MKTIAYRIRSKYQRLKIEYHHKRHDLDKNDLVISGRVANEALLTLRASPIDCNEGLLDNAISENQVDNNQGEDAGQKRPTHPFLRIKESREDLYDAENHDCGCACHQRQTDGAVSAISDNQAARTSVSNDGSSSFGSEPKNQHIIRTLFSFAVSKKHRSITLPSPIEECDSPVANERVESRQEESRLVQKINVPKRQIPEIREEHRAKGTRGASFMRRPSSLYSKFSALSGIHSEKEHCDCSDCIAKHLGGDSKEVAWKVVGNRCSLQAAVISFGGTSGVASEYGSINADLTNCKPDIGTSTKEDNPQNTSNRVEDEVIEMVNTLTRENYIGYFKDWYVAQQAQNHSHNETIQPLNLEAIEKKKQKTQRILLSNGHMLTRHNSDDGEMPQTSPVTPVKPLAGFINFLPSFNFGIAATQKENNRVEQAKAPSLHETSLGRVDANQTKTASYIDLFSSYFSDDSVASRGKPNAFEIDEEGESTRILKDNTLSSVNVEYRSNRLSNIEYLKDIAAESQSHFALNVLDQENSHFGEAKEWKPLPSPRINRGVGAKLTLENAETQRKF